MLKLISFSMSKLKVPYIQPFWAPLFNIGHEKHPFGYVMNFEIFLTFITHNKELYSPSHISYFSKKIIPKCHNPWDYCMSQICGKIFNSIISKESKTLFLWTMILELPRLQSLYFIENEKEKKIVSVIWFHFVELSNLHMGFIS
jgi:hypothetical protein